MKINDVQNHLVKEFSNFTDLLEKYKHILLLGKHLEPLEEKYKTENYAIKGCQSTVWIVIELDEGKMIFQGDSETLITKGILSMVLRVFNNQFPSEILETDLFFIEKIGLKNQLSPSRANGLGGIIKHIKNEARKYLDNHT